MAFSAVDTVVGWLEKVDQNAADKAAAGEGAISLLASGVLVDASMEHAQPDSLAGTTTREPPRTKGATSTPKQEQAAAFRVPTVAQLAPATKRILRGTGADLDGATGVPSLKRLQEATEALDDPPWSVDKDWLSAERKEAFLKLVDDIREQVKRVAAARKQVEDGKRDFAIQTSVLDQELSQLREEVYLVDSRRREVEANHETTEEHLKQREASLLQEARDCEGSLVSLEGQMTERTSEKRSLEKTIEETRARNEVLQGRLGTLREELRHHEASMDMKETSPKEADPEQENSRVGSVQPENSDDNEFAVLREARRKQLLILKETETELEDVGRSSHHWKTRQEREVDLERRTRSLTEQLVAKRAQVRQLRQECHGLQKQVSSRPPSRFQKSPSHIESSMPSSPQWDEELGGYSKIKRNKIQTQSTDVDSKLDSGLYVRLGKAGNARVAKALRVARTVDTIGIAALSNKHLSTLTVVYILAMHSVIMVILAFASARRAFSGATE